MREILRRLIPVSLLFVGLWLICWMTGDIWSVQPIDWKREQARRGHQGEDSVQSPAREGDVAVLEPANLIPEIQLDLPDFIGRRTRDRLVAVTGPQWEGFFNAVAATLCGRPPSEAWRGRSEEDERPRHLFFHSSEGTIPSIRQFFEGPGTFKYVQVKGRDRDEYLGIGWASGRDIFSYVPSHIAYPYRFWGVLLLIVALVVYITIPGLAPPVRGMTYSSAWAGWLPDLMAATAGGLFFAIPLLLIGSTGESAFSLSDGWFVLTAVCWLMAASFGSMWVISTMHATSRLEWDDMSFTVHSLRTVRRYRYDGVRAVEYYSWKAPGWLRVLAWGVSLLNWRAAGSAVVLGLEYEGFRVHTTDGRTYRYFKTGLRGAKAFLRQLALRRVSVAPEALALFEHHSDSASPARQARRAGKIGTVVILVLLLGGLATAAYRTRPKAAPHFAPGSFAAQAFSFAEEREPIVTTEW